ncbi:MAG: DUF2066 domain-containing protein [Geminicoccaceae bacterium]
MHPIATIRRNGSNPWRLITLGLVCLVLAPGLALAEPVSFRVGDIRVDATAENAVNARQQALAEGQTQAFDRILRRITRLEDHARLPSASEVDVQRFIQDFEITEEQVAATRYIATLDVAFDQDEIAELLKQARLPFTVTAAPRTLVVPVLRAGDQIWLWQENNPWAGAIERVISPYALANFEMPLGDLGDVVALSEDQALAGDRAALQALANRSGTEQALLVLLESPVAYEPGGTPQPMTLRSAALGGGLQPMEERVLPQPGESWDQVLRRSGERVQTLYSDRWLRDNLLRFDQQRQIEVGLSLSDGDTWPFAWRQLAELAEVRQVVVQRFSADEVLLRIDHLGDAGQLGRSLQRSGLRLEPDADRWRLSRL